MVRLQSFALALLIFVLAAIITPTPDILTMMAMGLPMYGLYESCIWIAWLMERKKGRAAIDG